ncbi:alpha/beta hydrolase superfamily [Geitlerinema sp. FC II]|nr:alpha/beta hydrolase superfamily [Geitlerinema sp. FC II]
MPYIGVRGVEHYYEWIPDSSPSGNKPVLVFLHGWAGSARYWRSTAAALGDRFDCLLYDMRGFGRSRLPKSVSLDYELETYADDLAVFLDEMGLDRVSLNAHSMGASIATLFLNRYPERIDRAILTCSGIFEYNEKEFTTFHKFGKLVVQFRPKWLVSIPLMDRIFMARFLKREIPSTERRAFLADFLMADYEAALGTIYTSVSQKAAETMPGEFSQVRVPTLLVSGEFDQIIPAKMGREAVEKNESKIIQYVMLPNTAHFPMLEDAPNYLKIVREFLEV